MMKKNDWSDVPVGSYLAEVRNDAGVTQSALSSQVTLSTATLSRIESGEKVATKEEVTSILKAIGTSKADGLETFLTQEWDQIKRPSFDHPDRTTLWEANSTLRELAGLRDDPEVKGVFIRQMDLYDQEIRRLCNYLFSCDHNVAFIGGIGVGKSTAICKLANLLMTAEEKLDRQIVLETGAGGITLCEVHVTQGPNYGIRIEPRAEDSIRKDVEDFAEYLFKLAQPNVESTIKDEEESGDPLGISKEVVRAIRNMSGLTEKRKKDENGRRVRIDPAKSLAQQFDNAQELAIQILTRMDLLRRNLRGAWYPSNSPYPPTQWLQELFSELNNGRNSEFSLPKKIEVIVPYPVFDSRNLPLRLIDTKGIDQTAKRQDLECHLDDPRTLVVMCSRFNDAPEVPLQNLLDRAKETGVKDIALKTIILGLPRSEEALAVKYDDGMRVEDGTEGCELKADQIRLRLSPKGLDDIGIEFFNAGEDQAEPIRDRIVKKIVKQRQSYSSQLNELSQMVENLIKNRKDEEVQLVFDEVSKHLISWVDNNRDMELSDDEVQRPLVSAIDGTRYASTVRAAVRRYGDWCNLDYYHHLAFGVRKLAVSQIGGKFNDFRVIVENLLGNDEYMIAKEFLKRILLKVEDAIDQSYKHVQTAGREIFKQTLESDFEFWRDCEQRWGQGKIDGMGYRDSIKNKTDDRFQSNYEDAHRLVQNQIKDEWEEIVTLLDGILQEPDDTKPV